MTLTKNDVAEAIAQETGLLKKNSVELVETLLELIIQTLESGEDVLISGFGKFSEEGQADCCQLSIRVINVGGV